jgi:ribonuclease Z
MDVVLTGTGYPAPSPGRAGPGCLVVAGGLALQFDAGRGTALRLVEAGRPVQSLDAVFVTHHHSDHLVDLPDVAMTRWVLGRDDPLAVVAPEGPSARFAERMLDLWVDELSERARHAGRTSRAAVEVVAFAAPSQPAVVWKRDDVTVSAVSVRHQPVEPAVAYRIDHDGHAVVVSGDTRVCAEVEALAAGADILVHEVIRPAFALGTPAEFIVGYHADAVELGGLAARAGVKRLVLTHLIPAPGDAAQERAFVDDVRTAGYTGLVDVGRDLLRVST